MLFHTENNISALLLPEQVVRCPKVCDMHLISFITDYVLDLRDTMVQTNLLLLPQLDTITDHKGSVTPMIVTNEKCTEKESKVIDDTSGDISPELLPSSQEKPSATRGEFHVTKIRYTVRTLVKGA